MWFNQYPNDTVQCWAPYILTILFILEKAQLENQAKKVEREENLMGEAKSKKIKIKKEIEEIILKRSEAKSNYKEAVEKIKNAAKLAKMEVEKEERRLLR